MHVFLNIFKLALFLKGIEFDGQIVEIIIFIFLYFMIN